MVDAARPGSGRHGLGINQGTITALSGTNKPHPARFGPALFGHEGLRMFTQMSLRSARSACALNFGRLRLLACAAIGLAALFLLSLAFPSTAKAEHTRFWRQSDFENFDRGTA